MEYTYELLEARDRFAIGQYEEALAVLEKIPDSERNAEWYAFRAEIEDKLERYYDALHSLRIAIELDPKNKVYKEQLKDYRKKLKKQGVPVEAKGAEKMTLGMAAGFASVCDSFRNKDCSGCCEACGEGCCEACGEVCCEALGEAGCDGCDCDCDCS
jgi:hypothetical protein